jgi:signal transduction histidine kinase/ligand-binding sensor domain-containing protein/CheY-like chemotaxis protein/AraC-like DNA-binding protein
MTKLLRNNLHILLSVLLALIPAEYSIADIRYRNISMQEGLRSNAVRSIAQDSNGFVWLGTDNGLCRYDGTRVQHYHNSYMGADQFVSALSVGQQGLLVGTAKGAFRFDTHTHVFRLFNRNLSAHITSFAFDSDGNVWLSTLKRGVFRCSKDGKILSHYLFPGTQGNIAMVMCDHNNQLWAVSNSGTNCIYRLDKAADRFRAIPCRSNRYSLNALALCQTVKGDIYIGSWDDGLLRLGPDGSVHQLLDPAATGAGKHIHTLTEYGGDDIYIGADDGLIGYNTATHEWHRMTLDSKYEGSSLCDKFVYSIMRDHEGGTWFGTFYSGVNYLSPVTERFVSYTNGSDAASRLGNVVSRFCEDHAGNVWIGSDDGGLSCYSMATKQLKDYAGSSVLKRYNVHALCFDGKNLWIGTYTNGVVKYDVRTGSMRRYTTADGLTGNSSYEIYMDSRHRLWAATMDGVHLLDVRSDRFRLLKRMDAVVIDIEEDKKGNIWLATQGDGLWRCDARGTAWKHFVQTEAELALPSNQVNCIEMDPDGTMWLATSSGLCRYEGNGKFKLYHLNAPSNEINSIVEDQGVLWLATTRGIIKYTKGDGIQMFNRFDGMASELFQPNAGLKTSDGRIFFGSVKGMTAFYPYKISINTIKPAVYITGLELFNKPVAVGTKMLPKDLTSLRQLDLSYDDNMFSLDFASLSYCSPEKNQYAYKLDGFDKDWNYVGNQHRATYTNIPPGTYTFRVRATNNDGVWCGSEAKVKIVVHPPFWLTLPAKILYLLLALGAIYLFMQYRLKKAERRHKREIRLINERQEEETRRAQLNFFTMIAHEIRTPVTLIIGPLETLMSGKIHHDTSRSRQQSEALATIDRNAHRLLELVNQLLDFSKVQQQGYKPSFALHHVSDLLRAVVDRFVPSYEQHHVRLETVYPSADFTVVVDGEGITKVVSNLLTNALKYGRTTVRLSCETDVEGKRFKLIVADDGIGISSEDQKKVFRPFFQTRDNKPGTGIGLTIVKNIVDQHHGEVSVQSTPGKGTVFTVTLPMGQADAVLGTAKDSLTGGKVLTIDCGDEATEAAECCDGDTMLIVEDDEDMLHFIAGYFGHTYTVLQAHDGVEALRTLEKHHVSLIVSDWMMPEMDGAELCRKVRANHLTSHIPFIMLTAKTDNDSKAESMNCGADMFIEKPFSMKYLEACIRNMIDMRRMLMQKFSTMPQEPISRITTNAIDDELLTRMNKIIEDNIDNPNLNVNFISSQLGISRSGLFAKIKAIAGVTPNDMIQVIRLRRAALLLKEQKYRVGEISYMVGFSSPSYFSKCFQNQFGVKPGEYCQKIDPSLSSPK